MNVHVGGSRTGQAKFQRFIFIGYTISNPKLIQKVPSNMALWDKEWMSFLDTRSGTGILCILKIWNEILGQDKTQKR